MKIHFSRTAFVNYEIKPLLSLFWITFQMTIRFIIRIRFLRKSLPRTFAKKKYENWYWFSSAKFKLLKMFWFLESKFSIIKVVSFLIWNSLCFNRDFRKMTVITSDASLYGHLVQNLIDLTLDFFYLILIFRWNWGCKTEGYSLNHLKFCL